MDTSIFSEKNIMPNEILLKDALKDSYKLWQKIYKYVHSNYSDAIDKWNYTSAKYGWSFRINDKKRAIIYLLPRENYFKAAFVFGQKATDEIMKSKVNKSIKDELKSAKVYAEGRGIRIDVTDNNINDVLKLIEIKLRN